MSNRFLIDVVIAVHDPARPVWRAVESVLAAGRQDTRVTVVCHGIDVSSVPGLQSRVNTNLRAVRFDDGVRSPAGPFNYGIGLATAEYVSIMGSDDWLEQGALDSWAEAVIGSGTDVFLAGLAHQNKGVLRNPPVRPWRRTGLDPVRDRLFHRSAPLGLIRRTLLAHPRHRLTAGLPTGEDLGLSTRLLALSEKVSVGFDLPRYVIGADAVGRVTSASYTLAKLVEPVALLFNESWFRALPGEVRNSAVLARVRGSVLSYLGSLVDSQNWSTADLNAVCHLLSQADELAPAAFKPLPLADSRVLSVLADPTTTAESAAAAARLWANSNLRERLLPARVLYSLHRESTLVRYLGYAMAKLGA